MQRLASIETIYVLACLGEQVPLVSDLCAQAWAYVLATRAIVNLEIDMHHERKMTYSLPDNWTGILFS